MSDLVSDEKLEQEFKTALKQWLDENPSEPNVRMARYFFWAGAVLGTQLAKELYAETIK